MKKCVKAVSLLILILAAISVFAISAFAACTTHQWEEVRSYVDVTNKCKSTTEFRCANCSETKTEVTGPSSHKMSHIYDSVNSLQHCDHCIECGTREYSSHSLSLVETITNPTCSSDGAGKYKCSICDYEITKSISKVNHDYSDPSMRGAKVSDATCTSPAQYKAICSYCGLASSTVTHPFGGLSDHIDSNNNNLCDVCNTTMSSSGGSAGSSNCNHSVSAWDGTENGKHTGICNKCSTMLTASCEDLDSDDECDLCFSSMGSGGIDDCFHFNKSLVSSTLDYGRKCVWVYVYRCDDCGFEEEKLGATHHTYRGQSYISANADEHYIACIECGTQVYSAHSKATTVTTSPTCTKNGIKTTSCSICKTNFKTETVEALGHIFEDGICSVCGVKETGAESTSPEETTKTPDESTKAPEETTSSSIKNHEHNLSAWKKLNEKQHVSECQDPDCAYKLPKNHLDKDFDKKCDDCGCDYSEDISLKSALGIALGAAMGFGVLYMVAAIVRSGRER